MIFLILLLALILRLVNLNQSLWLDEAVQALTAKGSFWGIFTELKGDFHPPFYHLLMWFWVRIFGSSEVTLRMPSVLFGMGTVYLVYKIINELIINELKDLKKTKLELVATLFIATAPFHIYYSQEARGYSMTCFFATLSMFYFMKITINGLTKLRINGLHISYLLSTLLMIYSNYYGFLILLAQMVYLAIKKEYKFIVLGSLVIMLCYLPWLPMFVTQIKTGMLATQSLPGWGRLVNVSFLKALPLTFIKFSLGRITIFNKFWYGIVSGSLALIYGTIIGKVFFKNKKSLPSHYSLSINHYSLIILFWLFLPITVAWLVSFFIPNYQPFRLILTLPAFYILLVLGISRFSTSILRIIGVGVILGVNLFSLGVYYLNPYFHREDWRGVADLVKKSNTSIIISAQAFDWPLVYYRADNLVISVVKETKKVELEDIVYLLNRIVDKDQIYYTPYLADLYDPQKLVLKWLEQAGFVKIKEESFNQIPVFVYWKQNYFSQ